MIEDEEKLTKEDKEIVAFLAWAIAQEVAKQAQEAIWRKRQN